MGTDNSNENSVLRHSISNHSVLVSELKIIQINCLCSCLFSIISVM